MSEHKPVFAGHNLKSLTVETSDNGITYLWVEAGNEKTLITLMPSETRALARALGTKGETTEITCY